MRLPMPNPKEVEKFKALYFEKTRKLLTDAEASDTATRAIHLYCMTHDWHSDDETGVTTRTSDPTCQNAEERGK